MALDVTLIIIGLVTTFVLAFASHDSESLIIKVLFWISLFATAGTIILAGISGIKADRALSHVQAEVVALKEYSTVAQLDALGNPPGMGIGSDIRVKTELVNLLEGTYEIKGSQIYFKRDSTTEQRYRAIIQKYPKFPFGYYYLALCLRDRNDESWRQHAEHAVEILKMTTQIDGHNTNHDEVLRKILEWLDSGTKTKE